ALTGVIVQPISGLGDFSKLLEDTRRNAALIGPGAGVGAETRDKTLAILAAGKRAVLDADALTSFAGDPESLFAAIRSPVVMTPHEGEFARLFEGAPDVRLEDDKLTRARIAARLMGAVVLIKGADTVVAAPDGRATIGFDLPPWLATAGSGDVLAGLVSGLAAQGMAPFEAASAAVWLHGACGRAVGPGLIAEDLPEALPGVLRGLIGDHDM
ncbi:MAG: ADP/ATP-dependent (S)-NAD(P)H-hydrate dehydratase, partial [Roseiarcus sp.]